MAMTNRQLEVLDYIKRFIANNGYSPTVREIAAGLSLKSPSTVQEHLKSLVKNGIITTDNHKSRTIELLVQNEYLNESERTVQIPLLGNVHENLTKEFIEIPKVMLADYDPKKLYAFKKDKSLYVVNTSLCYKERPSLVIHAGIFQIVECPKADIFGNIISEFRQY